MADADKRAEWAAICGDMAAATNEFFAAVASRDDDGLRRVTAKLEALTDRMRAFTESIAN